MMKNAVLFSLIVCLLVACSAAASPLVPSPTQPGTNTPTSVPKLTLPPSVTATATPTAAEKPQASATPTVAIATATLSPTPAQVWVIQGPGKIICPILLYHHVEVSQNTSPYYVTPAEFRVQLQALKDWGYTSIPVTLLVKAINFGAELPARPVVISFDDGDQSVYSQAFPIMKELGFTGVNYIVVNYVGMDGFMSVDQLKELAAAGWETGSHSMTHPDLTHSKRAEWEVVQSRHSLEKMLGVPVETFAYPYGIKNADMVDLVKENYRAGLGLGSFLGQDSSHIFYLWRRPVMPGWDLKTFGSYLPWSAP